MNRPKYLCLAAIASVMVLWTSPAPGSAGDLVDAAGAEGGLVVHLGCGDGRLTAPLRTGDGFLVQGLDADAANVTEAREHLRSLGIYGPVSAEAFDGRRLPYADDLVNLLVVSDRFDVPGEEILRVLAPGGAAMVADGDAAGPAATVGSAEKLQIDGKTWAKIVKPWPEAIDEWTHYLHGPDNNAVAHDTVVGPPRHMQWLADPEWARNHHRLCSISSVVTARGRLFCVVDEATAANMNVPGKWAVVARDAFSGVTLWKKPLPNWTWYKLRFRSGPPQVTRLLVASGDRLYVPLGLSAPVSCLDAATGKTLATYEATGGAEEIVLADGVLLVLRGAPVAEQAVAHAAFKGQFELPNRKSIVALDPRTGKTLWEWSEPEAPIRPETLASDGRRAYVQVGEAVVCLDLKSGEPQWTYGDPVQNARRRGAGKKGRGPRVSFGTNVLVVADGVVLAQLSGDLTALSADDGSKLWQCPAGTGFHAPLDVFVIDGLVWRGSHVSDSVAPPPVEDFNEARDLHTGEVQATNTVMVDLQTSGHHHRCYREKATDRFIITGKRGIEMMDLAGSSHSRNNWVRGACQYGIMPANGLMYAPSHACGCYMEAKLRGFWALAPERPSPSEPASRLERGPAFGTLPPPPSPLPSPSAWPTYRHDPLRSGVATTVVPPALAPAWKAQLGGRLTQPVVAGGKVFVAAADEHTVYALDEKTGTVLWEHVAGGRVDSPPTIHGRLVLFGAADGRVTCLRLDDGALVWRFLAAPADRRTVAYDQVESLWPVHGSVLVLDGTAYCSAGRSTWLDGGIDLFALDPPTGKVLAKTHFESRHPEFRQGKERDRPELEKRIDQNTTDYKTFFASDLSDSFSMAGGTVSDVLVSDGTNVFLHHVKFDAKLNRRDEMSRHLFSTSSLLDDAENHRSHWVLGTGDFSRVPVAYSWVVNRPGKRMPTIAVPTGVMMVFEPHALWAVQRQGDANGRYHLLKKENRPFSEHGEPLPDFRHLPAEAPKQCVWRNELPVRTTAILKSGDRLLLGVAPIEIPEDDPHAAYEGRLGGSIWVCSEADGAKSAELPLPSPVVWDGMAAAGEKLFVSTADGTVVCLGRKR